jgi:hypothetical protein
MNGFACLKKLMMSLALSVAFFTLANSSTFIVAKTRNELSVHQWKNKENVIHIIRRLDTVKN